MATKPTTTRRGAQRAAPLVTKPESATGKGLAVTPKVGGFRRAGYAFPDGETVIPLDDLDDRQYAQLTTEPMLVTYLKDLEASPDTAPAT
ncbi:hypothetical protein AVHY2522_19255 [Acidovorax sp. SUPP2522]|uniref:HI1506-related protein n=1 Tax=unclassified Acidovorax TaxID=2684926 RepID=UPI00234BAA8F|nr:MULTISPECIES: HI1506-related protein [unclassified Acidovorax]WCM99979.1 HI1506-related protein [Acidovorax sp. GBBC 1281]GKT18556.1 hypothetical protein AVHY2522_19255 [Acidovorax sp. SUPP2522]